MTLGTVLIVDDEAYARQALGLMLAKAGYHVIEAGDGARAIELMAQDDNAFKVDTIICDLQMPHVDGEQAIIHFKRHYPDVPIVIITGAPDFALTEVLKNQGVTDYLIKPVKDKRLLDVIRVTVRLHELRKGLR